MNQVIGTVRTYQTSAGQAVEARITDPTLGDVRVIVTGRIGEVIQAQLVVRDRGAADAITQAAARVGSTSDALAGVNLTVRSESNGASTGGRSGNAFESAGWGSGYAGSHGHNENARNGQSLDNQAGVTGEGSGNGSGRGSGSSADTSRNATSPHPAIRSDAAHPGRPLPKTPLTGGSSLDIRA